MALTAGSGEGSNQIVLQESRLSVSNIFINNFSGQSSGHKGCSEVSVFMP